ncbi:MAG: hypothetical protein M0Z63_09245 [Actinomycetota bacterium]|nr:hypothetical protein [Actinomycetota bacterium]
MPVTGPFPIGAHPRLGAVVGAPCAAGSHLWAAALVRAGWSVGGWIVVADAAGSVGTDGVPGSSGTDGGPGPDGADGVPGSGEVAGGSGSAGMAGTSGAVAGSPGTAGLAGSLRCFRTIAEAARRTIVHAVVIADEPGPARAGGTPALSASPAFVDRAVACRGVGALVDDAIHAGKHVLCPVSAVPDRATAHRWAVAAERVGAIVLVHGGLVGGGLVGGGHTDLLVQQHVDVASGFLRAVLARPGDRRPGILGVVRGPGPVLVPMEDVAAGAGPAGMRPSR